MPLDPPSIYVLNLAYIQKSQYPSQCFLECCSVCLYKHWLWWLAVVILPASRAVFPILNTKNLVGKVNITVWYRQVLLARHLTSTAQVIHWLLASTVNLDFTKGNCLPSSPPACANQMISSPIGKEAFKPTAIAMMLLSDDNVKQRERSLYDRLTYFSSALHKQVNLVMITCLTHV